MAKKERFNPETAPDDLWRDPHRDANHDWMRNILVGLVSCVAFTIAVFVFALVYAFLRFM